VSIQHTPLSVRITARPDYFNICEKILHKCLTSAKIARYNVYKLHEGGENMLQRHKLKEQRLKMGYTQEKVAELTGIERTRYTRIETGKAGRVALFEAFAISKALISDINELFASDAELLSFNSTGTDQ